jgi:hypothetical protein
MIKLIKISFCFYQLDENWLYNIVSKLVIFWSFKFDVFKLIY